MLFIILYIIWGVGYHSDDVDDMSVIHFYAIESHFADVG